MDHQLTPPLRPKPQSGAALIVTLTLLLLITGLAISLFMTANTELQSASQFKNSQGLTELSDICVNLVMGQIKDATTTNAAGAPASRSTWASQPGMIRTYGSSTNSYKLYSWVNPRTNVDDTTTVPTGWFNNLAQYTDLNEPIPNSTNTSTNFYRYPIAYPPLPATDTTRPLGYDVLPSAPRSTGGAFTNQVPMPVQWLYVLKDGTMDYPAPSASGNNATISGASAANPIVARLAYWTDDETSKVNINTAAGGEYWATPVQRTGIQFTNSVWQPTRWEFQRYPGHPARTDLQAVFPDLTRQQIWAFTPRVSDNGATAVSAMTTQPSSVAADSDRLLASVGEARFSSTNFSGGERTDFTNSWSGRIETNKFLITASSRAPEVTLYGTPRVSIWPIPANTNSASRSTLDRLFAFCSTIQNTTTINSPRSYYFVRSSATNMASDVANTTNTAMFTYLDSLSSASAIPGIGSESLVNKYTTNGQVNNITAGRDQLVTQFYDYIRCVNKLDAQVATRFSTTHVVPPTTRNSANGTTTYGFGKFPTINQVAIHFICTADGTSGNLTVPIATLVTGNSTTTQALTLNAGFTLNSTPPAWNRTSDNTTIQIPGLNCTVTGTTASLTQNGTLVATINPISGNLTSSPSATLAISYMQLAKMISNNTANYTSQYSLSSNQTITITPTTYLRNLSLGTTYAPLAANEVCIPAIAYIEPAMPACSFPSSDLPNIQFTVSGLDQLTINGQPMNFPSTAIISPRYSYTAGNDSIMDAANIAGVDGGGILKYLAFLTSKNDSNWPTTIKTTPPNGRGGFTDSGYPLVSDPIRIANNATMNLGSVSGGPVNVTVRLRWPSTATTDAHTVTIPFSSTNISTPTLSTNQTFWAFSPTGWDGANAGNGTTTSGRFPRLNPGNWETNLFQPNDTVFAMATVHADYRISMVRPGAATHWSAVPPNTTGTYTKYGHRLWTYPNIAGTTTVPGANYPANALDLLNAPQSKARPPIPSQSSLTALGLAHPLTYGDFDNSIPSAPDGPYINASDDVGYWNSTGNYQYWGGGTFGGGSATTANFHTPNRKISSPVAFGSLPSAAVQDRPWQNLLFRPAPGVAHPGKAGFKIDGTTLTGAPPDYAWLDFFWMPIVEPWAISETFSTAGKINMNYQIAPFSYIRRTTGVQAVLKSGGVTAVSSVAAGYTTSAYDKITSGRSIDNSPFPVNLDETLRGFDARLINNAALFRTASEICELPIVPVATGATYSSLQDGSWWANWRYTGDNTKEATYNDIYPRLTTKSNTYTVHYRVQMLKKLPGGDQTTWDESKDKVASELRGSTLIERFLDPNATYPDYATAFSTSASLETLYRFRVLQRSQFTP